MHVLNTILPIFLIILSGKLAVQIGYVKQEMSDHLLIFILKIALPALIFSILSQADLNSVDNLKWLGSFAIAVLICFVFGFLTAKRKGYAPRDAIALGATSSLPNDGMISIPLLVGIFGNKASGPIGMGMFVISAAFVFTLICLHLLDPTKRKENSIFRLIVDILRSPLVLSMLLGVVVMLTGWELPKLLANYLAPLSGVVMGGALFAIGMELDFYSLLHRTKQVAGNIFFKLLVMPGLTLGMALFFDMKPFWAVTLVIAASSPSIKSIYLISKEYSCNLEPISNSVVGGTTLAIFSMSFWLFILAEIWPDVF